MIFISRCFCHTVTRELLFPKLLLLGRKKEPSIQPKAAVKIHCCPCWKLLLAMDSADRARGFRAGRPTSLGAVGDVFDELWREREARPFVVLNIVAVLWASTIFAVAHRTNSLAMLAFGFWCVRDALSVTRHVVRFWVVRSARLRRSQYYTWGFGRLEVLVSYVIFGPFLFHSLAICRVV